MKNWVASWLLFAFVCACVVAEDDFSSLASTDDVIKAMESIGLQENRSISEMAALVTEKIAEDKGQPVSRRLAPTDVVFGVCGVDFLGYAVDLSSMVYKSAGGCAILCMAAIKGCNAVTWSNYKGGTCWFKGVRPEEWWYGAMPKTGAVTFMRLSAYYARDVVRARTYANFDMSGGDYVSRRGYQDASWCAGVCNTDEKCFGSTWTDFNGGTCWFKTKSSTLTPKAGAVSTQHYKVATVGFCKM